MVSLYDTVELESLENKIELLDLTLGKLDSKVLQSQSDSHGVVILVSSQLASLRHILCHSVAIDNG